MSIYFDHGSTSWPKAPGVPEAVASLLANGAYNINRGNYMGAYEVESVVLDTRDLLGRLFHIKDSRHVIFTPGITYSLNYFIKGFLKKGDHVLVTGLEHNAVMRPLQQMADLGVCYDILPTDLEGNVKIEAISTYIRSNTRAMIATHASNVCGTIVPIEELRELCRKYGLFFVVDSAQSAGTLEIDMEKLGIDFLAFAGHKGLLGPQGIGGFLISDRLNKEMIPCISGGTGSKSDLLTMPEILPDKYESGTMNLPGIAGLCASLQYLEETGISRIHRKKMELTEYFLKEIQKIPQVRVVGRTDTQNRVAVVSLNFLTMDNAIAAARLEQQGAIMTRVGLHCAPVAHRSLGTFPGGTVRFSFGEQNTTEEIDTCIRVLLEI
ncbi:MAG: aminotransferase class V-fold PLP-dependent enzyme, partial [Eubacteriales bacterium]|nr:aminotransferase class V-fold PLP-dependent enzyme [Eubacteriales bacterium]